MPECHKPFLGHCDLDPWPSFKNCCVQSISHILFDEGIPNLGWWFLLGWRSGAYHIESLWPWHWLLASFLGFSCYITANFPQMCLMLDQILWGHSSHVCDISCSNDYDTILGNNTHFNTLFLSSLFRYFLSTQRIIVKINFFCIMLGKEYTYTLIFLRINFVKYIVCVFVDVFIPVSSFCHYFFPILALPPPPPTPLPPPPVSLIGLGVWW